MAASYQALQVAATLMTARSKDVGGNNANLVKRLFELAELIDNKQNERPPATVTT